jgi:hypothetical protein
MERIGEQSEQKNRAERMMSAKGDLTLAVAERWGIWPEEVRIRKYAMSEAEITDELDAEFGNWEERDVKITAGVTGFITEWLLAMPDGAGLEPGENFRVCLQDIEEGEDAPHYEWDVSVGKEIGSFKGGGMVRTWPAYSRKGVRYKDGRGVESFWSFAEIDSQQTDADGKVYNGVCKIGIAADIDQESRQRLAESAMEFYKGMINDYYPFEENYCFKSEPDGEFVSYDER